MNMVHPEDDFFDLITTEMVELGIEPQTTAKQALPQVSYSPITVVKTLVKFGQVSWWT